ncbi:MAG TPA: dienelactone hydrolase family protein [Blastocatellia bacterium]|nr:dienelactone hydrolase family protein [Blastocatellia bacterium]
MATAGKMIEFQAGGRKAQGYLAEPEAKASHPALIVIHEWWGLNDHIKDIAERFAAKGYIALAPDLYDGTVTKDPAKAGELMQGLAQERALEALSGAVNFLKGYASVKAEKIGVTGFCMGGTFALLLACFNSDIKASAPFYGDVPPDDVIKNLSAPVLFIGAQNDPWITRDKMERLRAALKKFGKEGEVKIYSGVGHAFFNDTRPEAYDREAAQDAWERVGQFLTDRLGGS